MNSIPPTDSNFKFGERFLIVLTTPDGIFIQDVAPGSFDKDAPNVLSYIHSQVRYWCLFDVDAMDKPPEGGAE